MNNDEIEAIGRDRLESWRQRLVNEHSTPILLVGVGHDHKSGQVTLLMPEEMSDEEVKHFLMGALNMLKMGRTIVP